MEWSLRLPVHDTAIYGGTTSADRIRLRAARAGRPVPLWLAVGGNAARGLLTVVARASRGAVCAVRRSQDPSEHQPDGHDDR